MKKFVLLLFIGTLLTGCSYVKVDDISSEKVEETNKTVRNEFSLDQIIEIADVFDLIKRKSIEAQDIYYLALGDSLTRGVGDEYKNYGFTGILAERWEDAELVLSVELDNRGKNGRRSDQLLALLERGHYDEELAKVDVVSISLGGNDVMRIVKRDLFNLQTAAFEEELEPFAERYDAIIDYIRAHTDAPILMVGFYNPFSIITDEIEAFQTIMDDWNGEIEKLAMSTENACFIGVEDLFDTNMDMVYHTDFFHPNAKGYKKMADRILETIPSCDLGEFNDLIAYEEVNENE